MRLIALSGIDQAGLFGAAARGWSVLTGVITVLLIATRFSPVEQGYYYTFMSLVAIQVFFELGLGQVLIQFASHEWSHLTISADGRLGGDETSLSRLASLAQLSAKWFGVAAIPFFCALVVTGEVALVGADHTIAWRVPWLVLCVGVSLDLMILPAWSLIEGCNHVRSVYALRLLRAIVTSFVLWASIALHGGLWSLPISYWVAMLTVSAIGGQRHFRLLKTLLRKPVTERIGWLTEIWPMQWRIAMSWLSGYFSFFLFTPVLFKFDGPVAAGRMGMSWNVIAALSGVSTALVQVKAPQFGIYIAQKRWRELDRSTLKGGASALVVMTLGAVGLYAVVSLLPFAGFAALADRFLDPGTLALFLIGSVVAQATMPLSIYLRAHKREPLMFVSIASGLLIGTSTVVLGKTWGATGMGWGYLAVSLLVSLPFVGWIFLRSRAAWHNDISVAQSQAQFER